MSYSLGNKLKITVFGQSHSDFIGVTIDGLPYGYKPNTELINEYLQRRSGLNDLSTCRREKDEVKFISGLLDGKTCGAPLTSIIENQDVKSKDYSKLKAVPRPSHADYVANVKYLSNYDYRGGGQFSGRMTTPLCIAGAIAIDLLSQQGITIKARIKSIKNVEDGLVSLTNEEPFTTADKFFPTIDEGKAEKMKEVILEAKSQGDSVGGKIECFIYGMPIGVGEPNFDSLESKISSYVFSIPAVKGIEFGNGFDATYLYGSENNDDFYFDNDIVKTKTNNSGGINGGISNGMPIVFTTAIKPTPSIYKEQNSVNLNTKSNETLIIEGRHDPCIVPRALPVIECMTALAIYDLIK